MTTKLFDPYADSNGKPNPFVNDPGGVKSKKAHREREIEKAKSMAATPLVPVRVAVPEGVDQKEFEKWAAELRLRIGRFFLPELIWKDGFVEGETPSAHSERAIIVISDIFKDMVKFPEVFKS